MSRSRNRVPLRLVRFDIDDLTLDTLRSPLAAPSLPSLLTVPSSLLSVSPATSPRPASTTASSFNTLSTSPSLRSRISMSEPPVPVHGQAGCVQSRGVIRCTRTSAVAQSATAVGSVTLPLTSSARGIADAAESASLETAASAVSDGTVARALSAASRVVAINAAVGESLQRCSRQRAADMTSGPSERRSAHDAGSERTSLRRSVPPNSEVDVNASCGPRRRSRFSALIPSWGSFSSLCASQYDFNPTQGSSQTIDNSDICYLETEIASCCSEEMQGSGRPCTPPTLELPPPSSPPCTPRPVSPSDCAAYGLSLHTDGDGPLLPSLVREQTCVALAPELLELTRALQQYSSEGPYAMGLRWTGYETVERSSTPPTTPTSPRSLVRDFLRQQELWEVIALREQHRRGRLSPLTRPSSV